MIKFSKPERFAQLLTAAAILVLAIAICIAIIKG